MPWFRIDDQLYSHPKWLAAPTAARALWVTAGSWCAAHLTDGLVPRHVLPMLGGKPKDAAGLVAAGLWVEDPEGWRFHDWSDLQPSASEVRDRRAELSAKRSEAGRKGAAKRWQADGKAMANGKQTDSPYPTRPVTPQTPRALRAIEPRCTIPDAAESGLLDELRSNGDNATPMPPAVRAGLRGGS